MSILDQLFNEIEHKALIALTTDKCLAILGGAYAITILQEHDDRCERGECRHNAQMNEFMKNSREFLLAETTKINEKGKPDWERWTKGIYLATCKRSVEILEGTLTFTFDADQHEIRS